MSTYRRTSGEYVHSSPERSVPYGGRESFHDDEDGIQLSDWHSGNHPEHVRAFSSEEDDASPLKLYTQEDEQKVVKKLDTRLVLFVALLYLLSFLDRSSMSFFHLNYRDYSQVTYHPSQQTLEMQKQLVSRMISTCLKLSSTGYWMASTSHTSCLNL